MSFIIALFLFICWGILGIYVLKSKKVFIQKIDKIVYFFTWLCLMLELGLNIFS